VEGVTRPYAFIKFGEGAGWGRELLRRAGGARVAVGRGCMGFGRVRGRGAWLWGGRDGWVLARLDLCCRA
jgi:hypothetical protein